MFLSFILMNMENFCKGGGDGFRRFNGFYGFNGVDAAHNKYYGSAVQYK